jgi:pimeloyl-ACP methyl ester carboxylesterase
LNNDSVFSLQVHKNIAMWTGGSLLTDIDLWFLHAFGDSSLCFRDVFSNRISKSMRIFLFDLPGHGASPPRPFGLTVEDAAEIWCDLVLHFSSSRRVVLVGHSMASIIAVRTAQILNRLPALLISVEGNLTLADAYFSGQAANFDQPQPFYNSFRSKIFELAKSDEIFHRFSCNLQFADPRTLWTLGRSVLNYPNPGQDFLSITCPGISYWDPAGTTEESKTFLATHTLHQRKLEGLGHWPMIKSSAQFYAAIEEDVLQQASPKILNCIRK